MSDSFVTPWTVACQAPLSTGFPRQEYWNGLPFPSPRDLSDPGIKPASPALAGDSLPLSHLGSPLSSLETSWQVGEPVDTGGNPTPLLPAVQPQTSHLPSLSFWAQCSYLEMGYPAGRADLRITVCVLVSSRSQQEADSSLKLGDWRRV